MQNLTKDQMTPKEEHQRSKSEELLSGSKTHIKRLFSNLSKISRDFKNSINNIRTTNSAKNLRELSSKKIICLNKGKRMSTKENISKEKKGEIKIKIEKKDNEFNLQNLYGVEYQEDENEKLKNKIEELKSILSKKEKETILLNKNLKIYENKINNNKNEINELKEILKSKEKYIDELNEKIRNQEKKYLNKLKNNELEIKQLLEKCQNLDNKCHKIENEYYSTNIENSKLLLEINQIKYKNIELEKSLESEVTKNKISLNSIKNKEDEIQILLSKLKVIGELALNSEKKFKNEIAINTPTPTYRQIDEKIEKNNHDNFGKIGIKNELLNCYMSSILQIMKNIKPFSMKLLNIKTNDNIIESLQNILNDLLYSKKQHISIYEFKRQFGNVYKRFNGREDNDSTYFLIYLIQHIHKYLNKRDNQNISRIEEYSYLELNANDKIEVEKFLNKNESKNNSFIYDLFYGYKMDKIFCTGCNYNQITCQSFNILDIPIMNENKRLKSLEECLNCFLITKDQKGRNGFDCSKCKKKLLSFVTGVLKLPKILIINLKRVGETVIYNHEIVIPFTLKTKDVEKLNKFEKDYELIGFVKHFGTDRSGHNIAYSKNLIDNKWYLYNDEIVREVSEYPPTDKSFLLFYQLMEKHN